jgi:hypothetical protein
MVKSIYHGMGYNLRDDRASDNGLEENDLLGCTHCQRLLRKTEWQAEGGFCHSCNAPVCSGCAARIPKFGCTPFLRQLETQLEQKYRREQNARLLGI